MLRKLLGPKKEDVTGRRRQLHNEQSRFCWPFIAKYYSGDEIKENNIRGVCGTYRGEMHERLWWGNLEETDHRKTQA